MFGKRRLPQEKPSIRERLSDVLEVPGHIAEGLPEISLLGNREAVIDRYQGVLEYNDCVIRLNVGKGVLKFTGRNLVMKTMDRERVTIRGFFTGIEFIQ